MPQVISNVPDEGNPVPEEVNFMSDTEFSPGVRDELVRALESDPFFRPLLRLYGEDAIVGPEGRYACASDIDRFKPLTAAKLTALSIHRTHLDQCAGSEKRKIAAMLDASLPTFLARLAEYLADGEPVLKELILGVKPETDWPWQVIEWTLCWR